MKTIKDDFGEIINPGDFISFSYGIPPVDVKAEIINRDGKLIALTPGHNPSEASLSYIKKWFNIYKELP